MLKVSTSGTGLIICAAMAGPATTKTAARSAAAGARQLATAARATVSGASAARPPRAAAAVPAAALPRQYPNHMALAWSQALALPRCDRRSAEETGPLGDEEAGRGRAGAASRFFYTLAELRFAVGVLGLGAGVLCLASEADAGGGASPAGTARSARHYRRLRSGTAP